MRGEFSRAFGAAAVLPVGELETDASFSERGGFKLQLVLQGLAPADAENPGDFAACREADVGETLLSAPSVFRRLRWTPDSTVPVFSIVARAYLPKTEGKQKVWRISSWSRNSSWLASSWKLPPRARGGAAGRTALIPFPGRGWDSPPARPAGGNSPGTPGGCTGPSGSGTGSGPPPAGPPPPRGRSAGGS